MIAATSPPSQFNDPFTGQLVPDPLADRIETDPPGRQQLPATAIADPGDCAIPGLDPAPRAPRANSSTRPAHVRCTVVTAGREGVTLLNRSVVRDGLNDSADALAQLSEALFETQVLPCQLLVLDKVQGASHFDLPVERAIALHARLAARLPGYLVPRPVRGASGAPAKLPVTA
jgi:hypothetical protein